MNATVNSTTGMSPHYVITGRRPNIGLPKLPHEDITYDDPETYSMQITALRQVHQRVALAQQRIWPFVYKDYIKVLFHRPQSTIDHS